MKNWKKYQSTKIEVKKVIGKANLRDLFERGFEIC